MTNTACEWCGDRIDRASHRGRPPRFCSSSHRQQANQARRRGAAARSAVLSASLSPDDDVENLAYLLEKKIASLSPGELQKFNESVAAATAPLARQMAEAFRPLSEHATAQVAKACRGVLEIVRASIDFKSINLSLGTVRSSLAEAFSAESVRQLARDVATSIDVKGVLESNHALLRLSDVELIRLPPEFDLSVDLSAVARAIDDNVKLLADWLQTWLPENLRSSDLEAVAQLMLEEGIALSWVPRPDIVEALLDADGFGQRLEILMARRDDILDDCRLLLAGVDSGVGQQCRAAVDAMAAGHDPPAQSHASNIIDSIVLQLLGRDGRSEAKTQARVELAQLPLRLVCENLALRPLFRAFATWHPTGFDPPPDHFSRHATAHAVGRNGVFESAHALVAVMIATSLVRQFGDDLAAQL